MTAAASLLLLFAAPDLNGKQPSHTLSRASPLARRCLRQPRVDSSSCSACGSSAWRTTSSGKSAVCLPASCHSIILLLRVVEDGLVLPLWHG
jgi:hypothetical protein